MLFALVAALLLLQRAAPAPATPAAESQRPAGPTQTPPNPTIVENRRAGSSGWEITRPALDHEIEGYASKTSVNSGETIELFVSTRAAKYTIDVFRMGWYGGQGARQMAGPIDRPGIAQIAPSPDAVTGLIECDWREPFHLDTHDAGGPWPSGVYLARLTVADPSPDRRKQSFIVFVVREDDRASALVFQSSVTTFAAYNNWGGKSLYDFNSANGQARKVSFDRPYAMRPYGARLDGAGDFLRRWEYNAVRFLEREGYDVTYITDVDTHANAGALLRHTIFLSVGSDAYWSWAMRDNVQAARDHGVHLAFLGAAACFWQIRFEPDASGNADRTVVGYRDAAGSLDPLAASRDPKQHRLITTRWRERPVSRPEERLIGVMYADDPVDGDIVVDDASHWVFAGTGLKRGDALIGLLGVAVDAIHDEGPPNVERLAHSPYPDPRDPKKTRYADMTIYQAPSGALVFATGSMQWNWGLDDYNARPSRKAKASAAAQQITRNVLNRMLQGRGSPVGADRSVRPSLIVVAACVVAFLVVLRAWRQRPRSHG